MERKRMGSVDRISELPMHIIHNIISLLSPHSLAVSSTLSNTWRQAYVSFPELYICEQSITRNARKTIPLQNDADSFNCVKHNPYSKFYGCTWCIIAAREKLRAQVLTNFVDGAFLRFQKTGLNLQKLTLHMSNNSFGDRVASTVERWIDFATAYNLYELHLFFLSQKKKPVMPSTLLANGKSLRALTLTYCKFEDNFLADYSISTMQYPLQKLTLSMVDISDSVLARLLSCCPLVSELGLIDCLSIKTLCVDSLSKLKKVRLENTIGSNEFGFEKIVIKSPQLRYFHLKQFCCREECEVDLGSCRASLEVLEISCWVLPKSFSQEAQVSFSSFTHLETLSLHYCKPLLERIDLSRLKSVRDVSILAPQSLEFNDPSIGILFGSLKSQNGERTTFNFAYISRTCWIKQMILLLSVLNKEESVSLHIPVKDLGKFQHKDLRVNPKSRKCRLYHLELKFEADCNCKDIVDALFNTCCIYALTLTWHQTSPDLGEKTIQLGLPKRKGEFHLVWPECCGDSNDACWRHYVYQYEEIKGDSCLGDMKLRIHMQWPEYRDKRKYIEETKILAGPKIPGQCNVYDCLGLPCFNF